MPEYVKVNDSVTLACEYDLEDVALYTIKWYWNGIEFYRFVPKESPPSKAFTIANFNVDVSTHHHHAKSSLAHSNIIYE